MDYFYECLIATRKYHNVTINIKYKGQEPLMIRQEIEAWQRVYHAQIVAVLVAAYRP